MSLPTIIELKRTLTGVEKRFECWQLARSAAHVAVLWIAPQPMHVHGIDLPAGTVSFGHFWSDRNYNVYHWMRSDSSTIGYYFNISDTTELSGDQLRWRDLTVDVLCTPQGRLDVLDEDELPADLPAEILRSIAAGKAAILDHPGAVMAEVEEASRALIPLCPFAFEGGR
jgi:predicted RNA-binding protein associated with RNAse of E/G family